MGDARRRRRRETHKEERERHTRRRGAAAKPQAAATFKAKQLLCGFLLFLRNTDCEEILCALFNYVI